MRDGRLAAALSAILCLVSTILSAGTVNILQARETLVANDPSKAEQNTQRIARIMESVPAGGPCDGRSQAWMICPL